MHKVKPLPIFTAMKSNGKVLLVEERATGTWKSPYKFNGKELDQETGLYYYGARYYDPNSTIGYGVDPLAEKLASMSPYSAMGNNPIYFIDPDGREIAPASQKEWDRQKQYVIGRRDKLQGKVDNLTAKAADKGWSTEKLSKKVGDLGDRVTSLTNSISTLGILEASDQVYSLNKIGASEVGGVTYNLSSGNLIILFGSTSNFVHETTHGGQFESGDLAFSTTSGLALAQEIGDEISAYKTQYAFDPSSTGGKNFNTINSSWVQSIKDPKTRELQYSNHGGLSVNINFTTQHLLNAYPNNTQFKSIINALSPEQRARELQFRLKEYPNVHYKK